MKNIMPVKQKDKSTPNKRPGLKKYEDNLECHRKSQLKTKYKKQLQI